MPVGAASAIDAGGNLTLTSSGTPSQLSIRVLTSPGQNWTPLCSLQAIFPPKTLATGAAGAAVATQTSEASVARRAGTLGWVMVGSLPHATDELVHAPVDAEELHDGVEQAHGEQAPEPRHVDEPRHDEATMVAANGVDDAVGGILWGENRQQQPEAGLHPFEHARADVEGADDGGLDLAAQPA